MNYSEKLELYNLLTARQTTKARTGFHDFCIAVFEDFESNWHHELINAKLDEFAQGKIKRLIINLPPQHGKSELSSRLFPAYLLGRNPDCKIGIFSYAATLSQGFNLHCQRYLDSECYQQIFPATRLPEYNGHNSRRRNTSKFEIVGHKGFYFSSGVGSGIGEPLDVGIIDDLYKGRLEAESSVVRSATWDWFTNVFLTRFKNWGQVLILMTRWHEDDIVGRLLEEPEKWEVIKLPAIAKEDEENRKKGEALWPKWHSLETLSNIQSKAPRVFDSLFQQDPHPQEGNIFKREWFEVVDDLPPCQWRFFLDTAYTQKTENDPTALMAAGTWQNDLYIRHSVAVFKEFPDLIKYAQDYVVEQGYRVGSIIEVEPKASGLSIVQSLKRNTRLNVKSFKFPKVHGQTLHDKDKVTRAYAAQPFVESGRVKLVRGAWNDQFLQEVTGFPSASHDDQVDCLVMAVTGAFMRGITMKTYA